MFRFVGINIFLGKRQKDGNGIWNAGCCVMHTITSTIANEFMYYIGNRMAIIIWKGLCSNDL